MPVGTVATADRRRQAAPFATGLRYPERRPSPTLTPAEAAAVFGSEYVTDGVTSVIDFTWPAHQRPVVAAPAWPRCPRCGCETTRAVAKHMARAYRLLPDEAEMVARAFRAA